MSELTFKRFGTQIDCSRNAVMNVESIKKWIDLVAAMGHNTLMMYTEDTYEVDGHPYFGYGRGRLTREEMKEINAYGAERGIELIPSINTLAHMGTIFRWKQYADIHDCEDIMLCDDERTYELIDAMFRTLSECYTSKVVNVGMDEAGMLGRGKYYDAHGDARRIDIIYRHLQKVAEIAKKYGKELLIYSDMFYSLATHAEYSDENARVVEDVATQIPDNVSLVYWNYYKRTVEDYSAIMNVHRQIKPEGLWYYGGTWNWFSFNPENSYGIAHLSNAIRACQNTGVENMIISMWGDDGGECGRFASLPAVFWATELAKGNADEADIKKKFEKLVGVPFDDFIKLDLTSLGETERYGSHPSRYILYNDPFIGLMDLTLPESTRADHEKLAAQLAPLCKHPKWGYMFETMHDLCAVAAEKCDIGPRIRAAYDACDLKELKKLARELRRIAKLVRKFYLSFRRQWMLENKGHGFDVSDARIGGVMTRLESCADRLEDYIDGRIERIEELEEELLDVRCPGHAEYGKRMYMDYWGKGRHYADIVSANVVGKGY
ncbi:MAG: beta-N-acetylhexosaminidase [Oscillospiraceae bacterium]|nr:beta-N-acetylhexosaminidase [Oscillospiraceae bacterium]